MRKIWMRLEAEENRCNRFFTILYLFWMVMLVIFSIPTSLSMLGDCLVWGMHCLSFETIKKRKRIIVKRGKSVSHLRKE